MATGSWIAANHAHLPELQKQRFASSGCVIARAHEPALSYPHFRRQVQSLMGELQEKPGSGESLLWPRAGTGEHSQPGLHGAPSLRFLGVPHGQARGSPGTNCPGFHKDVTRLFILSPLCGQTLWGWGPRLTYPTGSTHWKRPFLRLLRPSPGGIQQLPHPPCTSGHAPEEASAQV